MSRDLPITTRWFVGPFDELAVLGYRAGTDQRDEVGCVDGPPPGLCRCDERERHRDTGGAGAGALGDSLAKPELARKFRDNAVRSLPEERAARTLALPHAQSVEDYTALLTSAGER